MSSARLIILYLLIFISSECAAQQDSNLQILQQIPLKYISAIDDKIDKYHDRISSKTEKTLAKLSRWENKIQSALQKVNPEAAQRLFGEGQNTFSTVLQKIKEGKTIAENYKTKYDEYRDKLNTNLKYLEQQKNKLKSDVAASLHTVTTKINNLDRDLRNSEAVELFIKGRKKQLLDEATKYIGQSKWLRKIDKEAFYYIGTLKNYKELFSDKKKVEEVAVKLLHKIPAFNEFVKKNSLLGSIFRRNVEGVDLQAAIPTLAGLQTRGNINALIQARIATGTDAAANIIKQQVKAGQVQLGNLKDQISGTSVEIPLFKPNMQKTKTLSQRMVYDANMQFSKSNVYLPTQSDIAVGVGYKINDKSVIGVAVSVKVGVGTGWNDIHFSMQGIGFRSYIDWKIKGNFFLTGGYEQNYISQVTNISQFKNYDSWQASGLVGLGKKIKFRGKNIKVQVLYDMLCYKHVPVTRPFVFRTGFVFQ